MIVTEKLKNPKGSKNYLVIGIVVLVAGVIGVYTLVASHAATISYSSILNYTNAAQTQGVSTTQSIVNSIGAQTVNQIAPGGQLTYLIGGKTTIKSICYYVTVLPLKGGGASARIRFSAQSNTAIYTLNYDPSNAGNFQVICLNAGTGTPQPFNVANLSTGVGPAVLVYQAAVSY